jgi:mRNA interferase MazF
MSSLEIAQPRSTRPTQPRTPTIPSTNPTNGATLRRSAKRPGDDRSPSSWRAWWCVPPQIGRRPVVVLSRDAAIPRLRRALVAPCTTTIQGLAGEVVLEPGDDPVQRRTVVNLDSVESVSVGLLVERLGRLSDSRMRAICGALEVAIDCR